MVEDGFPNIEHDYKETLETLKKGPGDQWINLTMTLKHKGSGEQHRLHPPFLESGSPTHLGSDIHVSRGTRLPFLKLPSLIASTSVSPHFSLVFISTLASFSHQPILKRPKYCSFIQKSETRLQSLLCIHCKICWKTAKILAINLARKVCKSWNDWTRFKPWTWFAEHLANATYLWDALYMRRAWHIFQVKRSMRYFRTSEPTVSCFGTRARILFSLGCCKCVSL